ncbi:hypothetical protein Btru_064099 [Bulinus truncatus]|nr:hypothetical protein Btru_064099 [Bulinus truncatus]
MSYSFLTADCSNRQLAQVPTGLPATIRSLNMSYSHLHEFSPGFVLNYSLLNTFVAQFNSRLTRVLQEPIVSTYFELTKLDLSHKSIHYIQKDFLEHTPYLTTFILDGCNLFHIDPSVYANLKILDTLEISRTSASYDLSEALDHLQGLVNSSLKTLRLISLSHRKLLCRAMGKGEAKYLQRMAIEELDLSENKIVLIGRDFVGALPKTLKKLVLMDNRLTGKVFPTSIVKSLFGLIELHLDRQEYTLHRYQHTGFPPIDDQYNIIDINDFERTKSKNRHENLSNSSAIRSMIRPLQNETTFCTPTCATKCAYTAEEVTSTPSSSEDDLPDRLYAPLQPVTLFAGFEPKNVRGNRFHYDAYVVYEDDVLQFIFKVFVKELEVKRGRKLLLADRDIMPGTFMTSAILSAVQNSYKTILVVTPDLYDGMYSEYAVKMAIMEEIYGQRQILHLCLYQPTDPEEMSKDLLSIMHRNHYTEYPPEPDRTEDLVEHFWDQLSGCIQQGD